MRREVAYATPWFQLHAKTVADILESAEQQCFYSFRADDYLSVLAITVDQRVVNVLPGLERGRLLGISSAAK